MKAEFQKTAKIVGILFIIATVIFSIGNSISSSFFESANFLSEIYPNKNTVLTGALIELLGVLAIPLIAVAIFPILKRLSEPLALSYIVFRIIESLLLILSKAAVLPLINLSQQYTAQIDANSSYLQALGTSIQSISGWFFFYSVAIVFPLGALLFYYLLYQSKLVPRFLSAWGLLSAALLLVGSVLIKFEVTLPEAALFLPIAINEMVLALWLIIKGFSQSTVKIKKE